MILKVGLHVRIFLLKKIARWSLILIFIVPKYGTLLLQFVRIRSIVELVINELLVGLLISWSSPFFIQNHFSF